MCHHIRLTRGINIFFKKIKKIKKLKKSRKQGVDTWHLLNGVSSLLTERT